MFCSKIPSTHTKVNQGAVGLLDNAAYSWPPQKRTSNCWEYALLIEFSALACKSLLLFYSQNSKLYTIFSVQSSEPLNSPRISPYHWRLSDREDRPQMTMWRNCSLELAFGEWNRICAQIAKLKKMALVWCGLRLGLWLWKTFVVWPNSTMRHWEIRLF